MPAQQHSDYNIIVPMMSCYNNRSIESHPKIIVPSHLIHVHGLRLCMGIQQLLPWLSCMHAQHLPAFFSKLINVEQRWICGTLATLNVVYVEV